MPIKVNRYDRGNIVIDAHRKMAGPGQKMAGGSAAQTRWHFVATEAAADSCCGQSLPLTGRQYPEIETLDIKDITGLCFECFHEVCQSDEAENLWPLYESVSRIRDSFSELEVLIRSAKGREQFVEEFK